MTDINELEKRLKIKKNIELFSLIVNEYLVIPDIYDCEHKLFSHEKFGPFSDKEILEKHLDLLKEKWTKRGYKQTTSANIYFNKHIDNYEIHYHTEDFLVPIDKIGEHGRKLYLFDKIPKEIITG